MIETVEDVAATETVTETTVVMVSVTAPGRVQPRWRNHNKRRGGWRRATEIPVDVLDEDVLGGVRGDPSSCPVNLALIRAIAARRRDGWQPCGEADIVFAENITKWIEAFDRGDEVGPISFTATIVSLD